MAEILEDDPNNNNTDGKNEKCYSLRPRSERKRSEDDDEEIISWPKKRPKKRQKPKPAPLSKYRRKTANARERSRMREINEAFDSLRRAVPHSAAATSDQALSATLAEPPPPTPPVCLLPPTPPISDSPLSPPPEISTFTELQDFDPFSATDLDLEDFFFA